VSCTSRIKETIISILGTIALCAIACLLIPELRTPMLFLADVIYKLFNQFYLEDTILSVLFYIIIALFFTLLGVSISSRTENKIWIVVSILVNIVGLISLCF